MFSVAVVEPNRVELVEIPDPQPGPYEAVIKTEVSYLCNRTDRKLVAGHFPGVETYPLLLGHESAGIVDTIGNKVQSFKPGDRVIGGLLLEPTDSGYASGWGGFSEFILVKDHQAMVADRVADAEHGWDELYQIQRVVPGSISARAAGLLCTWREVYAGFSDFQLNAEDDILIFGAGPVGVSFVKFARLLGMNYIGCVDPHASKREKALAMGADEVFTPQDPKLKSLAQLRAKPLDAVIDAVGSQAVINAGVALIKTAGSICVYGVIDQPTITIEKHRGPFNFNLFVHQWPTREQEDAAQEPLCDWINAQHLDYRDFITAEFPITDIAGALEHAASGQALKILLEY
jgi:D-arabinose 1-dehydrogenase-like Zn-dependent alcohol dehydrogenase